MNKWRGHVAYDTLRFDIAMNLRRALGLAMLLLAIIAVGCGESGGVAVEIGEQPPSPVVQPTVEVGGDVDPDFARPRGDDGSQLVEVPAAGSYGPLVIYSVRQWLEDKGIEFSELTEPPVLDVSTSALLGSVTIDRELGCVTLVEEGTGATYHLLWPDRTRLRCPFRTSWLSRSSCLNRATVRSWWVEVSLGSGTCTISWKTPCLRCSGQ